MLLRVVDRTTPAGGTALKVYLEKDEVTDSYFTDYEIALPSEDLRRRLRWYYSEYLQQIPGKQIPGQQAPATADHAVIERLVAYGQALGNDVCGSFHELDRFREAIEAAGYAQVDVELVSSDPSFWQRPWEMMILPGSRYVLSSVVRSFVRRPTSLDACAVTATERRYELKVPPPVPEDVARVINGGTHEKPLEQPLRILHIVSRPKTPESQPEAQPRDDAGAASLAFDASCDSLRTEGALDWEIWHPAGWETLAQRLASPERPIHIVHFDGPIRLDEGSASLILTGSDLQPIPIAVSSIARTLAQAGGALLSIDSRAHSCSGSDVSYHEALLDIAREALAAGLDNVLGLSELCDPWTSAECFAEVYRFCVRGLSLGQAVVEARKALQTKTQAARFTAKPVPFHAWPLLIHYATRPVRFFSEPHAIVEAQESQAAQRIGARLFGFSGPGGPPRTGQDADGPVCQIVAHVRGQMAAARPAAVVLSGSAGTGKTHTAHRVCWHLAQSQAIDYAFCFDFTRDHFSRADVLAMIAPVLRATSDDSDEVRQRLRQLRCAFVLDGLPEAWAGATGAEASMYQELRGLMDEFLAEGHLVLILGRSQIPDASSYRQWTLPSLSDLEVKVLAATTLRSHKLERLEEEDGWHELLTSLRGNPWLILKALPLLHAKAPRELARQIEERLWARAPDSLTDAFFEWQFEELPQHSQLMLLLCSSLDGAYLEMLSVAADQEDCPAPVRALMNRVGSGQGKFADEISLWSRHGFTVRTPYGHVIDPRVSPFLRSRREIARELDEDPWPLCFSQWVCEAVRLVTQGVLAQPTSPLGPRLLAHRRQWVPHLERLWSAHDFNGFMGVIQAFERLLKQAGLEREGAAWMLDLLGRTPVATPQDSTPEGAIAWLGLAARALQLEEATASAVIAQGSESWSAWLLQAPMPPASAADLAKFRHAARFLELYFQRRGAWARAMEVCQRLASALASHEIWSGFIQALQSLSRYQLQSGRTAEAYATEQRILDEVPYDDAPSGVKEQSMLGVLAARVARGVCDQELLDRVRELDAERGRLEGVLDRLQADIHHQQRRPAGGQVSTGERV